MAGAGSRDGGTAARQQDGAPTDVPGACRAAALTLRGGAVRHQGSAILLPGEDGGGTSQLVAALVRAGAERIADGEVQLDDAGRIQAAGGDPTAAVEIALIVATTHRAGVSWLPKVRHGTRAVLAILDQSATASGTLRRQVLVAARLAPRVTMLSGPRPDADEVAPEILAFADDLNAGRAPRTSAAAAEATAPALEVEEPSGENTPAAILRERLRAQPSAVMLYWYGRFGNRMHQYAYGVTYARLNGCRLWLPSEWEGTQLFAQQPHVVLPRGRLRTTLNRSRDQFDHPERRAAALRAVVPEAVQLRPARPGESYARHDATVFYDDMCCYHPSIFAAQSRAHLRSVFAFSEAVTRLDLYKRLADRQGTYDIAHLRRDDISNPQYNRTHVQGYSVISQRSYAAAFARFGFDPAAIEWVSDDYHRLWHRDREQKPRGRWIYPTGSEVLPDVVFDWLEDFLRLYFARTIFRANSSFSWWASFLSPTARVFSPVIDKRHIYGIDGLEEIDVDFVEGNHPHWMYDNADIRIGA